ncbi:MAG: UDP-N-acetylglucosamine 2-epimerase (non-hydrolyzing) [Myxococcota bacterium]|nr:UDP-N-acetylglucosamine 2-epimerase (non-hydrolyzing) [Myxococcota bacterium]
MSKRKIQVLAVAGARPNFMKIAPLLREMHAREVFTPVLIHTGQHYDESMSDGFFRDLGIPEPDANLGVGSGSHGDQTAQVLASIERELLARRPDAVLVVGDVNSTIAATLAAVKLHIPVAHVEAGLRSGDRSMPEEINRLMTDVVCEWLFTTEPAGEENLLREGVDASRIHFAGNVMIDTLLQNVERARSLDLLERLGIDPGAYAAVTLHRPSNVDDPARLRELIEVLEELNEKLPVVFPVHPRTAKAIDSLDLGRAPRFKALTPLGYLEFLSLMADAKVVLTDSGGLQEETTALGVPCLTLRDSTERPITVTHGSNTVVGLDTAVLRNELEKVLAGESKAGRVPEKWDGHAAERIVDILERDLGGAT